MKTTRSTVPAAADPPWPWPIGVPKYGTAAYESLPWPDEVPILRALDLCKLIPEKGNRRDLVTWLETTFGKTNAAGGQLLSAVEEIASWHLHQIIAEGGYHSLGEFNDDPEVTLEAMALAWNTMLNRLGYEVPIEGQP